MSYSPWGRKEMDTTERLALALLVFTFTSTLKTFIIICGRYNCLRNHVVPVSLSLCDVRRDVLGLLH